jgi:hypothetical protein
MPTAPERSQRLRGGDDILKSNSGGLPHFYACCLPTARLLFLPLAKQADSLCAVHIFHPIPLSKSEAEIDRDRQLIGVRSMQGV